MNSINLSTVYSIVYHALLARYTNKPFILTGKSLKAFSAGGCLKYTTKQVDRVANYLTNLHEMFYTISEIPNPTISLWTGFVIGTGAGIACSCRIRVAMTSTTYSMPENSIGLYANVGGTYHLSHLLDEDLGMYLALTGLPMHGADCYIYGLCNFYIEDSDFESVIDEIKQGQQVYHVINRYHR